MRIHKYLVMDKSDVILGEFDNRLRAIYEAIRLCNKHEGKYYFVQAWRDGKRHPFFDWRPEDEEVN